ncbi:glycosyltransferase [Hymenobacter busanensis]|uniref:Glycosyltransferase n=1 Tax=Hymenobacter busanensis TaxID=2607656 RepID=A0A7L4ZV48_9BACT|nr:glycosyltransferase [Hymenobacter busanensis]KAA9339352.1 glycosyltransferase [Hymenobacter busanensis]QHJ06887.1 glycosyltransferase [Hymenobacter busanensis]
MLSGLLSAYFVGWFAILLGSWLLFAFRKAPARQPLPTPLPRVSILIAARNEEAAIARCLRSIRALNYPPEKLEVLLGDDASTDRTAAVATAAMQGFAGAFRILPITDTLGEARGKANVLAHLARAATTDYFFITDADISLPTTWVQGLLRHATPGRGTVTGLTVVHGPRLFDQLQGLDWLVSLALVQVVSDRGQPVTAMGNNMLITRAAYQATGGYENLPFSVTEDYELFRAVLRKGFGWVNVFETEVLAESLPVASWSKLLHQRRRWLRGVEALPWFIQVGLMLYGSFYPALVVAGWTWGVSTALVLLAGKVLVQGLLTFTVFRRVGLAPPLRLLPLFEIYTLVLTTSLAGFRLLRRPFDWKGRLYRR